MATFRTHLQHLIAARDRLRTVAPEVAATLDAGWPSAVLGALAPDRRELTGETRVETHGYDHHDPESMRRAVSEWLARYPDAAALLRRPGAPVGHVAFVLGNLVHVSLDALIMLGRLNLLPTGDGTLRLRGVDRLPFSPAVRVSMEEVEAALLPAGFPDAEIRQVAEMVRELGTCDPKEMRDLRLEMPLCRLVPRQREITLRLYEDMLAEVGTPEDEARACLEWPTSVAVGELLAALGDGGELRFGAPGDGGAGGRRGGQGSGWGVR